MLLHSFADILSRFWDQSGIKSWMPNPNPSYCRTIDPRGSRWMGYPMRKIFVSILALKFTGIFYLGKLRYDLNGGEKNFDSFIRKLSRKPRFVMKTNCLPDYFCPLKILVFWLKKERTYLTKWLDLWAYCVCLFIVTTFEKRLITRSRVGFVFQQAKYSADFSLP